MADSPEVSANRSDPSSAPFLMGIGREQLFAAAYLILMLNAFSGAAIRAIEERGSAGAAYELYGISALLWLALLAGMALLVGSERRSDVRKGDSAIVLVAVLAALVPSAPVSSAALTLLSLWGIATAPRGATLMRASVIFLASTGALLWGRVLLAVFSGPLLEIDAFFSSSLVGAEHQGNLLWKEGAPLQLMVAPGCSSLQGISLALVFWATVNQYFSVPLSMRAWAYAAAAVCITILINVCRIGAMLTWPEHLDAIHVGWGSAVAMWTTLISVVAICTFGARHEISASR